MATFQQAKRKAENLTPKKISENLFRQIRQIEAYLIDLNVKQIEEGKNTRDNVLTNKNSKFTGVYSQATEEIAAVSSPRPKAEKKAGEVYNFLWEGEFIDGIEVDIEKETFSLFSTGTGTGEKKAFFDGYDYLLGLSDNDLKKAIDERLRPYMRTFFKSNF